MPLTDLKLKNAAPRAKPYKLSDSEGMHVLVSPSGSKLFRLKYRVAGREKLLSIGRYPEVSLRQARKIRDEARERIALGGDPSGEKQEAKREARRLTKETFSALTDLYLQKLERAGRAPATLAKNKRLLGRAKKDFGHLPVSEVKAPVILATLRSLEAEEKYETATSTRTMVGSVMRYGMALGWIDADPTPALRGAVAKPPATPRAAITDPKAFGQLLRDIDAYSGQVTTRIALQLMALLYPRPGDLRQAHWEEFDLEERVWSVPAARMKMRRPHRCPLPQPAIELLKELRLLTGHQTLLFPAQGRTDRPMSENTMNQALRRLGYSSDEMTAHGFRASFSTMANEAGLWHPDAIERALAHVEQNEVRRAYARGEHWDERVRMAAWWADFLAECR